MSTSVISTPDKAALSLAHRPEIGVDSPAERAWVPAYAAPAEAPLR